MLHSRSLLRLLPLFLLDHALAQFLPILGQEFTDRTYGTTLSRLTDASSSTTGGGGGFATHIYSQLQAFSTNNELVLLIEDGAYVIRRVSDQSLVFDTTGTWNAPRWHPTQANTIIHYDSNDDTTVRVQFTNVVTSSTRTVFTFPNQYDRIRSNQSFDEVSLDGRWMAGGVTRVSDNSMVLFALNLENESLGATISVNDLYTNGICESDALYGNVEPDWSGVSPLGNFLMVQWVRDGTIRCSGLESFDLDNGTFLGRAYDGHQHGDLGYSPDGTEYFMTTTFVSPEDNNLPAMVYHRLPGTSTVQPFDFLRTIPWGDGGHISCRGLPGACVISTFDTNTDFDNEIYVQYIDGSVEHLVKHQSSTCGYWVQPRASVSRDGSLVIFASDWALVTGLNSCGASSAFGRGEAYMIRVPSVPSTPPPPVSATPPPTPGPTTPPPTMSPVTQSPTGPPTTPEPTTTPPLPPPAASPTPVPTPSSADILLRTSLDDTASITNPQVGNGGTTTLPPTDFVPARNGNGAYFASDRAAYISFPASNINLNQGTIRFWYRPDYNAGDDDVEHDLVVVGDIYNPPNLVLYESDSLGLSVTTSDWVTHLTQAPWRSPLWQQGEWVEITAVFDNTDPNDSLRLYVDGERVDSGQVAGGWNVSSASPIYVGSSGIDGGVFSSRGILDDFIILDSADESPLAEPTPSPTRSLPSTSEPTPSSPPQTTGAPNPSPTVLPTPSPTPEPTPSPTMPQHGHSTLLHCSLDSASSISSPAVGLGGSSNLSQFDFVGAQNGNGASFDASTNKFVSFPTSSGPVKNVDLNRGEVSFWYRPNYDAGANDETHVLFHIGDLYNPAYLSLVEADSLRLEVQTWNWEYFGVSGAWREALWNAGEWVQISAQWDNTSSDSLRLFVNGQRIGQETVSEYWSIDGDLVSNVIHIGSGSDNGEFPADGIIDELLIKAM